MRSQANGRVVILCALGLGDLLVALPALRAVARAFPRHRRVLVAPAGLSPLVRLLDGAVTDVTHADFRRRVGTIPARAGHPDVAVNLHGRGPESHRALLATRPGRLVAFGHPQVPGPGTLAWPADAHAMVRWSRLVEAAGIPVEPGDWRLPVPAPPRMPRWRGATVLHPGAAGAARRWPLERWARVAADAAADGHRILISGSARERPLAEGIARRAGLAPDAVTAGRTSLDRLVQGLAQARLLVSGDTGVAHLATALDLPSVLLFGPSAPAHWGPPPVRLGARHHVLWKGRTGDPHGDRPDPGLLAIGVQEVSDAIRALVAPAQPPTTWRVRCRCHLR